MFQIIATLRKLKESLFHQAYQRPSGSDIDHLNCYFETQEGDKVPIGAVLIIKDRYEEYIVFMPNDEE